ncbi:hypothetical protein [Kitasatospora cineracea]|uniref:Uncharacterized protein n=1 Tax=Kitasatospora cineracea TaxID=88074 RepID=A0A3N4R348_9ACTN|nr:hypothetical protein [Kitasatospora cineracea]RPE27973.1 hypothetical protein EDD38_7276 [Kitasatospora cineracea]
MPRDDTNWGGSAPHDNWWGNITADTFLGGLALADIRWGGCAGDVYRGL